MAEITEMAVRRVLETVTDPATGKSVVASGMVSGSTISVFTNPLPRNRYFTSASAMSVPTQPATTVTMPQLCGTSSSKVSICERA